MPTYAATVPVDSSKVPTMMKAMLGKLRRKIATFQQFRGGRTSRDRHDEVDSAGTTTNASRKELVALVEALSSERAGFKLAYEEAWSERAGFKLAYEKAWSECVGFKQAYEQVASRLVAYEHAPPRLRARQLCFMHIGKSAGTSLQNLLLASMPGVPVFIGSPERFDGAEASEFAGYELIAGHFSLHHASKFRPGCYLATMFRDPTERVLSSYFFLRNHSSGAVGADENRVRAAKSLALKEFLLTEHRDVRAVTCNHQTRYLVGDWRIPVPIGNAHVEQAIANLDRFAFIGLTETYEQSTARLFADIGLEVPARTERSNVTSDRVSASDLSSDTRALVERLNAADRLVYEAARRRVAADRGERSVPDVRSA